jgi:hypothetical protein
VVADRLDLSSGRPNANLQSPISNLQSEMPSDLGVCAAWSAVLQFDVCMLHLELAGFARWCLDIAQK